MTNREHIIYTKLFLTISTVLLYVEHIFHLAYEIILVPLDVVNSKHHLYKIEKNGATQTVFYINEAYSTIRVFFLVKTVDSMFLISSNDKLI